MPSIHLRTVKDRTDFTRIIMKDYLISLWLFIGGIGVMSGILAFEIDGQFPSAGAYILVVLCMLLLIRAVDLIVLTGTVASLFLISFFFFPFVINSPASTINRIVSIAIVWAAVFIALRFRKLLLEERKEHQRLQTIVGNTTEGILLINKRGVIIEASPVARRIFGFVNNDPIGENAGNFFSDSFADMCGQFVTGIGNQGRLRRESMQCKKKDGSFFFADVGVSHFIEKNELITVAFVRNIAEPAQSERVIERHLQDAKNVTARLKEKIEEGTSNLAQINQELIKSQMLYKAMAHNFPDGIIGVMNRDMKYVLVDGKGLAELGLNSSTVIGDRLFDNIHSAISTYAEGALKKVFKGEHISFDLEIDGKYYNVSSVPIAANDGHTTEILVVVKNISSQKKLERELVRTLQKEKELGILKSRFVTMASHEFRTPLTTILSSTFLLENYTGDKLETEKKKHLERIKGAVRNLTELLNDFLSLGKLEEGIVRVSYRELNLEAFIEDIVQEVSLVKKEDQRIVVELDIQTDAIMMDKHLLRNILLNLLSNAIKYSPADGSIGLIVYDTGNNIKFKITDQGIGIPPDEQKFVFKRFFRGNNTTEIQGTGLGLNIVKRYVKLLKGKIEFTSRVNTGTSFTVTLPLPHMNEVTA